MQRPGLHRQLLSFLACLAVGLGLAATVSAGQGAFEAELDPTGTAYEINGDDQGQFWISDFDAGQVWSVEPTSGAYEVYAVLGSPSDARQAGGWLWWVDGMTNLLGRVSTADGAFTRWQVAGATHLYGTAVDGEGRLWVTSAGSANLYRLDPTAAELCTFSLPAGSTSNYIVAHAGDLWFSDRASARLLRLTISDNSLSWWSLAAGSAPLGMAVDEQGRVWYADAGRAEVAQLDPATGQLARYALSPDNLPTMLAIEGEHIWYTAPGLGSIGRLDPATAIHTDSAPGNAQMLLTPDCAGITPTGSGHVTITNGELAWTARTYARVTGPAGIETFRLPTGAAPWGIAMQAGEVWAVDQGRQQLVRLPTDVPEARRVYLPIIVSRAMSR